MPEYTGHELAVMMSEKCAGLRWRHSVCAVYNSIISYYGFFRCSPQYVVPSIFFGKIWPLSLTRKFPPEP